MKPLPLLFLVLMASYQPALSQDAKDSLSEETAVAPTAARILGTIPDGTPPPPPAEPLTPEAEAAFRERVATYRTSHPRTKMAFISATVFRSNDSPPRSLVRCWPEGKRQTITDLERIRQDIESGELPTTEKDAKTRRKKEGAFYTPAFITRYGVEALKQSFKLKMNPMKKPIVADEWEPYLAEKGKEQARLTAGLVAAESELNDRVYRLFNLTPDEIKLLQKEVEH